MVTRTCRVCGEAFETDVLNKVYCSPACAEKGGRLKSLARSRAIAARNEERRKAMKAEKAAKAAALAAERERGRQERREREIRKWGGVEQYEAHLAAGRRYRELRKAGRPTRRQSIERLRRAEAEDELSVPAAAPSDPRVCSVCGAELGDAEGDLCCLCARAVTRENAEQAAATDAQWIHVKTRLCHDCSKPCNGYRCPRCLRKWRRTHDVNVGDYDGRA